MQAPPGGNAGEDWTEAEAHQIFSQLRSLFTANGILVSNLPDNLQGLETLKDAVQFQYNFLKSFSLQAINPIRHFLTEREKHALNESWLEFTQYYQARMTPLRYNAHRDPLLQGGKRTRKQRVKRV